MQVVVIWEDSRKSFTVSPEGLCTTNSLLRWIQSFPGNANSRVIGAQHVGTGRLIRLARRRPTDADDHLPPEAFTHGEEYACLLEDVSGCRGILGLSVRVGDLEFETPGLHGRRLCVELSLGSSRRATVRTQVCPCAGSFALFRETFRLAGCGDTHLTVRLLDADNDRDVLGERSLDAALLPLEDGPVDRWVTLWLPGGGGGGGGGAVGSVKLHVSPDPISAPPPVAGTNPSPIGTPVHDIPVAIPTEVAEPPRRERRLGKLTPVRDRDGASTTDARFETDSEAQSAYFPCEERRGGGAGGRSSCRSRSGPRPRDCGYHSDSAVTPRRPTAFRGSYHSDRTATSDRRSARRCACCSQKGNSVGQPSPRPASSASSRPAARGPPAAASAPTPHLTRAALEALQLHESLRRVADWDGLRPSLGANSVQTAASSSAPIAPMRPTTNIERTIEQRDAPVPGKRLAAETGPPHRSAGPPRGTSDRSPAPSPLAPPAPLPRYAPTAPPANDPAIGPATPPHHSDRSPPPKDDRPPAPAARQPAILTAAPGPTPAPHPGPPVVRVARHVDAHGAVSYRRIDSTADSPPHGFSPPPRTAAPAAAPLTDLKSLEVKVGAGAGLLPGRPWAIRVSILGHKFDTAPQVAGRGAAAAWNERFRFHFPRPPTTPLTALVSLLESDPPEVRVLATVPVPFGPAALRPAHDLLNVTIEFADGPQPLGTVAMQFRGVFHGSSLPEPLRSPDRPPLPVPSDRPGSDPSHRQERVLPQSMGAPPATIPTAPPPPIHVPATPSHHLTHGVPIPSPPLPPPLDVRSPAFFRDPAAAPQPPRAHRHRRRRRRADKKEDLDDWDAPDVSSVSGGSSTAHSSLSSYGAEEDYLSHSDSLSGRSASSPERTRPRRRAAATSSMGGPPRATAWQEPTSLHTPPPPGTSEPRILVGHNTRDAPFIPLVAALDSTGLVLPDRVSPPGPPLMAGYAGRRMEAQARAQERSRSAAQRAGLDQMRAQGR